MDWLINAPFFMSAGFVITNDGSQGILYESV
jgi:hypothetical protein